MATTAVLNLGLNTKDFEKGEKKLSRGMSSIKTKTIALTAAIGAVGFAATKFIKSFSVQEDAVNDLATSLALAGDNVRMLLPEYAKFASEIQQLTVYGDELILSQMAYAKNLGVTTDKLKDASVAAIGLAAKFKIDLKTAFMLIGRASKGQTEMLSRYSIVLKEGSTDQEKFNQLLKIGADSFALAEQAAKTTSGQIEQTKNNWGDITENIGEFLVETIKLPKLLQMVNKGFKESGQILNAYSTIATQLSLLIGGEMQKAFKQLEVGVKQSTFYVTSFFEKAVIGSKKLVAKVKGDTNEIKRLNAQQKQSDEVLNILLKSSSKELEDSLASITKKIAAANKKLAQDYNKEVEEDKLPKNIIKAIERAEQLQKDSSIGIAKTLSTPDEQTGEMQKRNIEDALVKGSLEAFKKEKQTDKTQKKIEKWTRETAENTKNAGSASITVNQQTIAG